jgi:hypothetical protein
MMKLLVSRVRCASWNWSIIMLVALSAVLVAGSRAEADVLAYEPFNYAAGNIIGLNGGTGFGGAWDEVQGASFSTVVQAGSLGYTDSLGNSLVTAGGKLNNIGTGGTSQPGRDFNFRRDGAALGATPAAPVYTYFSFLGIRQGALNTPNGSIEDGTYGRGANISLFDGGCLDCAAADFERLNFGENSAFQFPVTKGRDFLRIQREDPLQFPTSLAAWQDGYGESSTVAMSAKDYWQFGAPRVHISVTATNTVPYVDPEDGEITNNRDWQENPHNGRFQSRFSQTNFAGEVSLMVARIEHYGASGDGSQYGIEKPDKLVIWMNPDLNAEPNEADADVVLDLAQVETRAADIVAAGGITAQPYNVLNDGNMYSFDRIRLFAGNASGDRAAADWLIDELRVGETYADVTPIAGPPALASIPEPGSLLLAVAALSGLAVRRRTLV